MATTSISGHCDSSIPSGPPHEPRRFPSARWSRSIAGILILVVPRLLNFIVAIYLIIIGLLGLFGGQLNLR